MTTSREAGNRPGHPLDAPLVLVAGVDVGNSTTEVALARVEPGREPEWLLVLRRPTSGPKGSEACAEGVADLLARAGRRLGERPHLLLLAELHPVETGLVELGRLEELDLARTAIARPASTTPSGTGVAAGRLRSLDELEQAPPDGSAAIPVIAGIDFERAAALLRAARDRGWTIAAAIVQADDAVLIGNRLDRAYPDRGRGCGCPGAAAGRARGGRGRAGRGEPRAPLRSASARGAARARPGGGAGGAPRRARSRRPPGCDRPPRPDADRRRAAEGRDADQAHPGRRERGRV